MTPTTSEREALVAFLNGEGTLNGLWFGEKDAAGRTYWWREHLAALTRQEAQQEAQGAVAYAQRLASGIWRDHYAEDDPNWQPFDDMMGVLSQIDNMLTGLTRKPEEATPHAPVDVRGVKDPTGFSAALVLDEANNWTARSTGKQMLLNYAALLDGQPAGVDAVITLRGIDEYGPMLDWHKHWTDFAVGTKFYRVPKP